MKDKGSTLRQTAYALKLIWKADKLLLVFTLFKNSIEQVFYVFFFVYLTKYIFNCIEQSIPYSRLFWFLFIACSLHVCIHFICGWYEAYRKIKTPAVYKHIFHKVIDISDYLELKDYESPEFYDMYARALDRCVNSSIDLAIKTGVFIGNVLSTIMSLVIIVTVDPALLVFMIIPSNTIKKDGRTSITTNILMIAPLAINMQRDEIISILASIPTPNVAAKNPSAETMIEGIDVASAVVTLVFLSFPRYLSLLYLVVMRIA